MFDDAELQPASPTRAVPIAVVMTDRRVRYRDPLEIASGSGPLACMITLLCDLFFCISAQISVVIRVPQFRIENLNEVSPWIASWRRSTGEVALFCSDNSGSVGASVQRSNKRNRLKAYSRFGSVRSCIQKIRFWGRVSCKISFEYSGIPHSLFLQTADLI